MKDTDRINFEVRFISPVLTLSEDGHYSSNIDPGLYYRISHDVGRMPRDHAQTTVRFKNDTATASTILAANADMMTVKDVIKMLRTMADSMEALITK